MKALSTEMKVGFFALIVLTILTYMTFKVGGFEWVKKKGYILYVEFKNIGGLDEKTRIKVAGVDAGIIEKIELKQGRARLSLRMDRIGSQQPALGDGSTIRDVEEVVDIDDMIRNLSNVSSSLTTLTSSLNETLTPGVKESLRKSFLNLAEITAQLKETISVNDSKLRNTIDNINKLVGSINDLVEKNKGQLTDAVGNIKDFSDSLKVDGHELVANLNKAAGELKAMVEENRPAIKNAAESLETISKKIAQGEGSLGKFVKDDRLYESINKAAEGVNKTIGAIERFRTFINFQADYLTKPKEAKGTFYLTLQPKPDKYYIIGVVSDPVGRVTTTTTTTDGVTVTEEKVEKKIEVTAHFAKRYKDAALRIGFTENTFGAGGDYFFLSDKGKLSVDVWDFSRDEEGAKNPHAKVGIDYFIFKNIFLSAGADNILNKKWRGAYAGAGLRFEDEDLKYIFGSIPNIPR
ncbi:MAG: MCE family protein [Nitrospirae bacterium]|nr:MCE family protein [Nitrospirota bacterium]